MVSKLFFYYYCFYNFVLRDDTPIYTSVFTVSASLSLIFVTIVNIVLVCFQREPLETLEMFATLLPILGFNSYYFLYRKKAEIIVNSFRFKNTESFLALFFLLFSIICMFFGPVLTRYIIELKN